MAGLFPFASGRLPIRHGVGGFTARLIHSFLHKKKSRNRRLARVCCVASPCLTPTHNTHATQHTGTGDRGFRRLVRPSRCCISAKDKLILRPQGTAGLRCDPRQSDKRSQENGVLTRDRATNDAREWCAAASSTSADVHPCGTEAHVAAVLAILLDLNTTALFAHDQLVLRALRGLRSTTVTPMP